MGDTPITRVLDFLISGRDFDYSLSDISRGAGIGWATLYRLWPRFVKNEIVISTRDIGNAKLFQLNNENEIVQNLVKLYKSILRTDIDLVKGSARSRERIVV